MLTGCSSSTNGTGNITPHTSRSCANKKAGEQAFLRPGKGSPFAVFAALRPQFLVSICGERCASPRRHKTETANTLAVQSLPAPGVVFFSVLPIYLETGGGVAWHGLARVG